LPRASRWLLWQNFSAPLPQKKNDNPGQKLANLGLEIIPDQPLKSQLQSSLRKSNF
jgi:hypothetical protein